MNKQKHWPISRYIWSKLVVCESRITIFVQIRFTQQWSSFSRMILWWSECSVTITVFLQLSSNVIDVLYDEKKKFVEAASSTFFWNNHIWISHENEWIANKQKKKEIHHKWQRNECGWKCFNICIYIYI